MKSKILEEKIPSVDIARYTEYFPTSGKLFEKAKEYLPAGVGSTSRAVWSGWEPYPLFCREWKRFTYNRCGWKRIYRLFIRFRAYAFGASSQNSYRRSY